MVARANPKTSTSTAGRRNPSACAAARNGVAAFFLCLCAAPASALAAEHTPEPNSPLIDHLTVNRRVAVQPLAQWRAERVARPRFRAWAHAWNRHLNPDLIHVSVGEALDLLNPARRWY